MPLFAPKSNVTAFAKGKKNKTTCVTICPKLPQKSAEFKLSKLHKWQSSFRY